MTSNISEYNKTKKTRVRSKNRRKGQWHLWVVAYFDFVLHIVSRIAEVIMYLEITTALDIVPT